MIINQSELNACLTGQIGNPHEFLGLHTLGGQKGMVVRALDPNAEEVFLINQENGKEYPLNKIHADGFLRESSRNLKIILITSFDQFFHVVKKSGLIHTVFYLTLKMIISRTLTWAQKFVLLKSLVHFRLITQELMGLPLWSGLHLLRVYM